MAVVGREAEIATIARHLDAMPDAPRALLLTGEPGIGKSTLLGEAIERATAQGRATLVLRPGPAEIALTYSGLTDLVDAAGWDLATGLPAPQRDALAVATSRLVGAGPLDQRTVATATLGVVREAARRRPVLLAIDDLQWLDRPTSRCLDYALRRLGGEPVAVIAGHRAGTPMPVGLDLQAALGRRLDRLRVGPLPPRQLERLLRSRMGHGFARYEMLEVGRRAGGNPFLALEMGRALSAGDTGDLAAEALIADDLVTLLGRRIERLPRPTQTALGAVAILSEPTAHLVDLIVGVGASGALDPAFDADVIERIGDRLSFTHPLFATAVVRGVSRTARRDLHHRAAEVTGPEERASHLAISASRPDAAVAEAIESGARSASLRGAPDVSARLFERAAELSPDTDQDQRAGRLLGAATAHAALGDRGRAVAILEGLLKTTGPGPTRSDVLHLLGRLGFHGTAPEAIARLREARAEAGVDERRRAAIDTDLNFVLSTSGSKQEAHAHAVLAVVEARASGDSGLLAAALAGSVDRGLPARAGTRRGDA